MTTIEVQIHGRGLDESFDVDSIEQANALLAQEFGVTTAVACLGDHVDLPHGGYAVIL